MDLWAGVTNYGWRQNVVPLQCRGLAIEPPTKPIWHTWCLFTNLFCCDKYRMALLLTCFRTKSTFELLKNILWMLSSSMALNHLGIPIEGKSFWEAGNMERSVVLLKFLSYLHLFEGQFLNFSILYEPADLRISKISIYNTSNMHKVHLKGG